MASLDPCDRFAEQFADAARGVALLRAEVAELGAVYDAASAYFNAAALPVRHRPASPPGLGRLHLQRLGDAYARGEHGVVMDALGFCTKHRVPLPRWLEDACSLLIKRARVNFEVKSWDDLLGPPVPKGTNLAAKRKHSRLLKGVHAAVMAAVQRTPSRPVDAGLFSEVGEQFHISRAACERHYYAALRIGLPSAADWKRRNRHP